MASPRSHYAEIVTTSRPAGSPIEAFDAQIAVTAMTFCADVATRDIRGFEGRPDPDRSVDSIATEARGTRDQGRRASGVARAGNRENAPQAYTIEPVDSTGGLF